MQEAVLLLLFLTGGSQAVVLLLQSLQLTADLLHLPHTHTLKEAHISQLRSCEGTTLQQQFGQDDCNEWNMDDTLISSISGAQDCKCQ